MRRRPPAARLAAGLAAACTIGAVHAEAIVSPTSVIDGTVIDFDDFDGLLTTGPLDVGPGAGADVSLVSTPFTEIGASRFELGDNGLWADRSPGPTATGDGRFVATRFLPASGALAFFFADPVAQVGAFLNQFQPAGSLGNLLTLVAYDRFGSVLETFSPSIDTAADSLNAGSFLGFSRTTADIHGFGIVDGAFALDNLTYSVTPVPAPTPAVLVLAGMALLLSRRRRPSD